MGAVTKAAANWRLRLSFRPVSALALRPTLGHWEGPVPRFGVVCMCVCVALFSRQASERADSPPKQQRGIEGATRLVFVLLSPSRLQWLPRHFQCHAACVLPRAAARAVPRRLQKYVLH